MKRILSLTLCIFIIFGFTSCSHLKDDRPSKINVSGTASIELIPDMVKFYVRISETMETTKEAQIATNEKISEILAILKNNNIKDEDIKTQNLEISTQYNWTDGKQERIGETVSQSLNVTVKNPDNFPTIIDSIGSVSGVSVYSVSFDASDKTSALAQARLLAYQDAKEKALVYCKASDMKLGKTLLINESYATYYARTIANDMVAEETFAMKAAYAGGASEIPSGNISVRVNVECEFEINGSKSNL